MMAKNEAKKQSPQGNEWEVVSLTASTYAASPGPKEVKANDTNEDDKHGGDDAGTSCPLFMSGHFVFPPNEHENLPLVSSESLKPSEIDNSKIYSENAGEDVVSEVCNEEGGGSSGNNEHVCTSEGLNDAQVMQLLHEKVNCNRNHTDGTEIEESGVKFIERESSYNANTFGSSDIDSSLGESTIYTENITISLTSEVAGKESSFPTERVEPSQSSEDDKCIGPDLPCKAWWRKKAFDLYSHAKEANAFWSVVIAAAVMGIVILGQQWQQDRWQALQLRWQQGVNNEKTGRMMGPISRLKDVIMGGHQRRGSFIRIGAN